MNQVCVPLARKVRILKKEKHGRLLLLRLLPKNQWRRERRKPGFLRLLPIGLFHCDCGTNRPLAIRNVWYDTTKSCGCLAREMYKKNRWSGHGEISGAFWWNVKNKARKHGGLKVTIKQAWELFLAQGRCCVYTGWKLVFVSDYAKYHKLQTASLDRRDNTLGYTLDNVQWVHKDINKMKNTHSEARFLELVAVTAKHRLMDDNPLLLAEPKK